MNVTSYQPEEKEAAGTLDATGKQPPGDNTSPGGSPARKKFPVWIPVLLAALALITLAAVSRRGRGPAATPTATVVPPPMVKVASVRTGNLEQTVDVTGTLRSNQEINLSSKIMGRVARLYVREGSRIRRGQLLIRLDDDDLRAQVAAAAAGVATAEARYRQARTALPARAEQTMAAIEQARAGLQSAQARYRQALLNESPRILAAQNLVTSSRQAVRTAQARLKQAQDTAKQTEQQVEAEVNRAESGVRAARAAERSAASRIEASEAALAEVRRGARNQQVAQAQAQVTLAEAQLRDADNELNRARILFEGGAAPRSALDTAQTRRDVAAATLESARQNLSLVQEGSTNEQVRQAEEVVRQAREGQRQATEAIRQSEALLTQAEAGRGRILVARGEVTTALAGLVQAQTNLGNAQAGLAQIPITRQETLVAREGVQQAEATLRQALAGRAGVPQAVEDVRAAQAGIATARANLLNARVNLGYARIYSPVNGVVDEKMTDVGTAVSPATPLLRLVSLDRVYLEAMIPETRLPQLKIGQNARVLVPALQTQPFNGYVTDIIPTADVKTRQFRARITIPSAPRELTPGAFARGQVITNFVSSALLVPVDAVQRAGSTAFVLVAPGDATEVNLQKVAVRTGVANNGTIQVMGNLRPGTRVVNGDYPVEGGDKVRVSS